MYESEFHITGPLLLDSYLLVVVVLMMNMLIASVLSNSSFQGALSQADQHAGCAAVCAAAHLRAPPVPTVHEGVLATNATCTHRSVG